MYITRDSFDQKPLFVRQGALQLWGTLIGRRVDLCRVRELYSLSDFYAELCYDVASSQPTCVCSFTRVQRLELYLERLDLNELIP
jgi:hypothetical protein